MPRSMTPAAEAALTAQDLRPVLFFEGAFPTASVRFWTGLTAIDWNGETWIGAGNLIGISAVEEGTEVAATGLTVSMAGVPTTLVSAVIADAEQGLPGRIWIGFLDPADGLIIDPVQVFAGRLDVPQIADGAETCVITITYESRLIDLNRPREFRYTHESQQVLYPGDLGLEYVAGLQDKEIAWG
jgi:hypothetical protein